MVAIDCNSSLNVLWVVYDSWGFNKQIFKQGEIMNKKIIVPYMAEDQLPIPPEGCMWEWEDDIINDKDALVLAGAEKAKVDYLVTLDKQHFFKTNVRKAIKADIILPGKLIEVVRRRVG